jgi:hypothetical protein
MADHSHPKQPVNVPLSTARIASELAMRLASELDTANFQINQLILQCKIYEAEIEELRNPKDKETG